jgi:hypothetical protein
MDNGLNWNIIGHLDAAVLKTTLYYLYLDLCVIIFENWDMVYLFFAEENSSLTNLFLK